MATKPAEAETPRTTHNSLAAALAAFQAEIPTVRKGNQANAGTYKYDYADLSDVTEKTLPLLGKHGVYFSAKPTLNKGGLFVLKYALRHEAGERTKGAYPLPDPSRTPPQQMGSAITYARRYILTAITGVAPGGDDDDASAAQQHHYQDRTMPRARQEAPAEPTRDFLAEAEAEPTRGGVLTIWREAQAAARAGQVPLATLDKIAAIGRDRAAAEAPPAETAEEPGLDAEAAEAAAIAEHGAVLAAQEDRA